MHTLAFLPNLGMTELLVLAFLGLLIFGKKLPEVGKSLGQGIVQFKKGLQGVETEIEDATSRAETPKKKKKKEIAAESVAAEPIPGADVGEPIVVGEKPVE